MAAPGGFSATLSNKLDKIDMSQVLAAVLKGDKQLMGHIRMGAPAHNIEVNWIEDELNPAYIIAESAAVGSIHASAYSTASLQRILRNNALIQPAGTEQVIQISTVTHNTLAGAIYGSTTYAAFSATKCYIIGMPYADIDDASDDISVTRTKKKNFMQVFERAVSITQTRKNMDMEAVMNELQLQVGRRTMEIKRELDMAVQMGYAYASGANTYSGDTELRTMAGIIQLIRDPDLDSTNEDTTVIDASSSALTVNRINSLAYKIYDAGGLDETADPIILVGPQQQRVIAGFESELRRVEQGERQIGYYRDVFLSDMGVEMPVVLDRWVPRDKLIILDRSRISLRPLQGDSWHLEKMAKTGRTEKWQLSGQYTLELRNADACHGIYHGLT
jgi:hypothetical protein